jgi:hypothetical protein
MEYIDGPTLATLLRGGPLEPARAVRIVGEIAGALDYAHRQGLIHRDVKPANILLSADGQRATLADFGLVRPMGPRGAGLTTTGVPMGTPDYMSPEQLLAERPLDGRSDLYSLGAVLYHALAGRAPYAGLSLAARVAAALNRTPPPPLAGAPRLPPQLDGVVRRALAHDPEQRFPTAAEFKRALDTALTPADATMMWRIPPPRSRPPKHLPLIQGAAAGALALALACGAVGLIVSRGLADTTPSTSSPATALPSQAPSPAAPAAALLATPSPAGGGRVLISDSFGDNRNRWPVDNLHTALDPGRYRVKGTAAESWTAGPDLTASDLTVEAEVQRLGGTPDDQYGVFFRNSLDLGWYIFAIDDNGYFYLARWVRTLSGFDDMTAGAAKVNAGGRNTLRVRVAGPKIRMKVNGAAIGEVTETKPFSTFGTFGLWADNNTQLAATRFLATTP